MPVPAACWGLEALTRRRRARLSRVGGLRSLLDPSPNEGPSPDSEKPPLAATLTNIQQSPLAGVHFELPDTDYIVL